MKYMDKQISFIVEPVALFVPSGFCDALLS